MTNWAARAFEIAVDAGLPSPHLFVRQIQQESGFLPTAYNARSGATGIAQIVPRWHPGVDATDPEASLKYAASLMNGYLQRYNGSWPLALSAYNAGPGAVERAGGVPAFQETRRYIGAIMGAPQEAEAVPLNEAWWELYGDYLRKKDQLSEIRGLQARRSEAAALRNAGQTPETSDRLTELDAELANYLKGWAVTAKSSVDPEDQAALELFNAGGASGPMAGALLDSLLTKARADAEAIRTELIRLDPEIAAGIVSTPGIAPVNLGVTPADLKKLGYGVSQDGRISIAGEGGQPNVARVLTGPGGRTVAVFSDGGIHDYGTIPGIGDAPYQVQVDRRGRLLAINAVDPTQAPVVIDPEFGFAEVDPQIKFAEDIRQFNESIAVQKAQVQAQFVGLELQRRGQQIQAISDDFARQVELGRMEYQEAAQRLDTVDRAFTQRRLEREQVLQYAVAQSSLRPGMNGETLTRLPFADQLSGMLSQITGQRFDPSQFDLPTTRVNPGRTAQDIIRAGDFVSPIPGLQDQLEQAREVIGGILGGDEGDGAFADMEVAQAIQGV